MINYLQSELRHEERLAEKEKHNREMLSRTERMASLQAQNCQIQIEQVESENNNLRKENQRLRTLNEKHSHDLSQAQENLELNKEHVKTLQQEIEQLKQLTAKYSKEEKTANELILQLNAELERLKANVIPAAISTNVHEKTRVKELHRELEEMRQKYKCNYR